MRTALGLGAGAACLCAAAIGCGGQGEAGAGELPLEKPRLERIGEFAEPIFLAEPPDGDGTLYVAERAGTIRAVSPAGGVARKPFVNVTADVSTEGEGGLLSFALAPDFARSGRVYLAYSSRDRRLVVGVCGRSGPCRELLGIPHPNPIHWGGQLTFGPDGELYLATGEGGPVFPIPARAQDPGNPLGKLLRLDPRTGKAKVVAIGLRNPWRYSFDRQTGDLWIGDVGDFTEEEVDRVAADQINGANFGWPAREGTARTKSDVRAPGAIEPELTYTRTGRPDDPRCAITGGYVVRDPELPALEGRYLYGDFCEGEILSYDPRGDGARGMETGLEVPRLASFAEDASGRIYALSLEGPVYRITQQVQP